MRNLSATSLLAGVVLCFALGGCGDERAASEPGDRDAEAPQEYVLTASDKNAYKKVLRGLRQAAVADGGYNALRRAKQLAAPHKAAIDAFCHFAWQIGVNREAKALKSHAYLVTRITRSAEIGISPADDSAIGPAMDQLQRVIALRRLNADLIARYRRACEG